MRETGRGGRQAPPLSHVLVTTLCVGSRRATIGRGHAVAKGPFPSVIVAGRRQRRGRKQAVHLRTDSLFGARSPSLSHAFHFGRGRYCPT